MSVRLTRTVRSWCCWRSTRASAPSGREAAERAVRRSTARHSTAQASELSRQPPRRVLPWPRDECRWEAAADCSDGGGDVVLRPVAGRCERGEDSRGGSREKGRSE